MVTSTVYDFNSFFAFILQWHIIQDLPTRKITQQLFFFNSFSTYLAILSVDSRLVCNGIFILIRNCGFSEVGNNLKPIILKTTSDAPNKANAITKVITGRLNALSSKRE